MTAQNFEVMFSTIMKIWQIDLSVPFVFYLVCEAIGTAATPGLLCQPRVIVKMIVEQQMECRLAGETEILGENLPQRHFCPSQNPTWPDPGLNPGRRCGKPGTNRLSYGTACLLLSIRIIIERMRDTNFRRIRLQNICIGNWSKMFPFSLLLKWILLICFSDVYCCVLC
jgi:hypothetical protein